MAKIDAFELPEGRTDDRCLQLLAELPPVSSGVVLDLGCGMGARADAVAALGGTYGGCDGDSDRLADLAARGFETHVVGLTDAALADQIIAAAGSRTVAAIVLLDTIAHVADTDTLLRALTDAAARLGDPALVLSIPNVAHRDVAVKLLALGHFDYTPHGLLDRTHLQLFTGARLDRDLARFGWTVASTRDAIAARTEQRFPADHPALADGTTMFAHLSSVRAQADDNAEVYEFVRRYHRVAAPPGDAASDERPSATPEAASARPFLSVIMRTRGDRQVTLRDALLCLAAQTVDDFEIRLMLHTADLDARRAVEQLVGSFAESFSQRVHLHVVAGGGRTRPLNEGLVAAEGRFIAFLDDDDVVTSNWVEAFASVASRPVVLRSRCYVREVEPHPRADAPYEILTRPQPWYAASFDYVEHLYANQTPICSYAIPRALVSEMRLRFDETLDVLEDWDLLLRAAAVAGVADSGEITSVYNFWHDRAGSRRLHAAMHWLETQLGVIERFDRAPLLLPAGSATRLYELQRAADEHDALIRASAPRLEALEELVKSLEHELAVYRRIGVAQALGVPRRALRKLRGREQAG